MGHCDFVAPPTIGLSPSIYPVQIPLLSLPTLQQITLPPDLGSSVNLLKMHRITLSRPSIKILNRTGPSIEPWGKPLLTGHQQDVTHHSPSLFELSHPVFYPANSVPIPAMGSQFLPENALRASEKVKGR